MAKARTYTSTYARFGLLKLQVVAILDRVGGLSADNIEKVKQGIDSPHYIKTIVTTGLYSDGTIGAELRFTIDWRVHALELETHGDRIAAPDHWKDGVATTVAEAADIFRDACKGAELKVIWSFAYDEGFDRAEVNKLLGFSFAKSRTWRHEPGKTQVGIEPLPEAMIVLSFALDD
jgi:hypothetical protein